MAFERAPLGVAFSGRIRIASAVCRMGAVAALLLQNHHIPGSAQQRFLHGNGKTGSLTVEEQIISLLITQHIPVMALQSAATDIQGHDLQPVAAGLCDLMQITVCIIAKTIGNR